MPVSNKRTLIEVGRDSIGVVLQKVSVGFAFATVGAICSYCLYALWLEPRLSTVNAVPFVEWCAVIAPSVMALAIGVARSESLKDAFGRVIGGALATMCGVYVAALYGWAGFKKSAAWDTPAISVPMIIGGALACASFVGVMALGIRTFIRRP